jgi:hypothetical protein
LTVSGSVKKINGVLVVRALLIQFYIIVVRSVANPVSGVIK